MSICRKAIQNLYAEQVRQYEKLGNSYDLRMASAALTMAPLVYSGGLELRRLQQPAEIGAQCAALYALVKQQIPLQSGERLLLLGTEEFMYPALAVGQLLEQDGYQVWCHATTRSPIVPMAEQNYPLQARWQLDSLYEAERHTYIYNLQAYNRVIVISDGALTDNKGLENLAAALRQCGNENIYAVEWRRLMRSSYLDRDVTILLKDITGSVEPQPAAEREKQIQSGIHYCEMLPLEYSPSAAYRAAYKAALEAYAQPTAEAIALLAEQILQKKGPEVVLVSLARAGIPIGILLKRYLQKRYGVEIPHYAISIIRGRGIDGNAMAFLLKRYRPEQLQFVDGWTGKGAILHELEKALQQFSGVSAELGVVSDSGSHYQSVRHL